MADPSPVPARHELVQAVPLAEAKNHLSALVAQVEKGEEIAITRRGCRWCGCTSCGPTW
jgi:hypothetical protein